MSPMACPYFIPTERFDDAGWQHPARLPLGAGWRGYCGAPGCAGQQPSDEELKQGCNLGYARGCSRLPQEREADAMRFSVLRDRDGQVAICYISELNYLPRSQGTVLYNAVERCWISKHHNAGVQKLAECFLQSYLERR